MAHRTGEIDKLLRSVALFPERAHLVGAYSLGKAQRVIALLRAAGYDKPIYLHGALDKITRYYAARMDLGELRLVSGAKKAELGGAIAIAPPSSLTDLWSRRFPDPVTAFASGWMRVRARARQRGIELPLVISDHADWDGLCATHRRDRRARNLGHARRGGSAGALVRDAAVARRGRCTWSATAMRARRTRRTPPAEGEA